MSEVSVPAAPQSPWRTLFSSASSEWRTPPELFKRCSERWGPFTLDAAASPENALCAPFFTAERSAFDYMWDAYRVWMNPPYGRQIGDWVLRAYKMVLWGHAERVVCLLPARTDTRWWQNCIAGDPAVATAHFLRGRVKFLDAQGNPQQSAPFPSAVVVFEKRFE